MLSTRPLRRTVAARVSYAAFVADEVEKGKRTDLVGVVWCGVQEAGSKSRLLPRPVLNRVGLVRPAPDQW